MTSLLKKAFDRASGLPEDEQDALASILLEEMESERRWDEAFQRSRDQLASLAREALAEDERGETLPLDEDDL
jgi:hypothetical protein